MVTVDLNPSNPALPDESVSAAAARGHVAPPRLLYLFSFFMLAYPVVYFPFASFIFELQSKGLLSLVLSPLFYVSSFFWVMTGYGVRRMRQWSWYTFLAAQLFTIYLNALNLINYSDSQTKGWAFALTILVQAYVYSVVSRQLRMPFLFPRIRWWESGLAVMHHLPVEVVHVSSAAGVSNGQLLDMNSVGCFVKTPFVFEGFEKIRVRVDAYGLKIDVPGIVVWRAQSTVTHPRGVGIQFFELDRNRRRKLRVIARRFEKARKARSELQPVPVGPESALVEAKPESMDAVLQELKP